MCKVHYLLIADRPASRKSVNALPIDFRNIMEVRKGSANMVKMNLVGQKFGRLTVLERLGPRSKGNDVYWKCICDCGNYKETSTYSLTHHNCTSCGCYRKEVAGKTSSTHGLSKTPLYRVYKGMKNRCYNPNATGYERYGGRGISVCDKWLNDFRSFYEWNMSNGYCSGLSIDRIDYNGNYCPENCRWVDQKTQANNTCRNVVIKYEGETHTAAEWEDIFGFDRGYISSALGRGWDFKDVIHGKIPKQLNRGKLIEFNGESHTMAEWIRITGITENAMYSRLRNGWSYERAFTEPLHPAHGGPGGKTLDMESDRSKIRVLDDFIKEL